MYTIASITSRALPAWPAMNCWMIVPIM